MTATKMHHIEVIDHDNDPNHLQSPKMSPPPSPSHSASSTALSATSTTVNANNYNFIINFHYHTSNHSKSNSSIHELDMSNLALNSSPISKSSKSKTNGNSYIYEEQTKIINSLNNTEHAKPLSIDRHSNSKDDVEHKLDEQEELTMSYQYDHDVEHIHIEHTDDVLQVTIDR
eukprot:CAMPEP_0197031168 /NCGR_PEP_ID=MMETSP1384-20130603/10251_1 /TAXON_ID=29189 /ORGANISM="Ammonia sp." /LENGTH=172 /DNA_ID=CAMNT_0042460659 /DNA_START=10 /DNA_END=525 /DNA_ORIENTATION=+